MKNYQTLLAGILIAISIVIAGILIANAIQIGLDSLYMGVTSLQ